jgi:hypothetical protein
LVIDGYCWLLVIIGRWLLLVVGYYWLLIIDGYWLLVVDGCWLSMVVGCVHVSVYVCRGVVRVCAIPALTVASSPPFILMWYDL